MAGKVSIAVNWAAACGGCDVALLDLEEAFLDVAALLDVKYWPVAMDFKRDDLRALPTGAVDIGLFNGAVRTSEQESDARLMRDRCKVLVAFGSCACFGGIPGLGNVSDRDGIFEVAYGSTPSTDNPDGVVPRTSTTVDGHEVGLPAFHDRVRALHQVVEVDVFAPGCPPVPERVADLVAVVEAFAADGTIPPRGAFLASDRGLCDECPRQPTRGTARTVEGFKRPHELVPDPELCLLDQGLVCMGMATRGGCGARCIGVNMPCRGCYGPLPAAPGAAPPDPGAALTTALAALAGPRGEWELPPHKIVGPARTLKDPLGTFYRFTYPISPAGRTVRDTGKED